MIVFLPFDRIVDVCHCQHTEYMIYVARSVLNGAGDAAFSMINGLMEVAGRVGFAVPLTKIPFIGVWGIFLTTGLTWALTGLVSMARYHKGKWEFKGI